MEDFEVQEGLLGRLGPGGSKSSADSNIVEILIPPDCHAGDVKSRHTNMMSMMSMPCLLYNLLFFHISKPEETRSLLKSMTQNLKWCLAYGG